MIYVGASIARPLITASFSINSRACNARLYIKKELISQLFFFMIFYCLN